MKVLFLLLCALIGGGIASGKEVYVFFYRFGGVGLAFCLICPFIMSWILCKLRAKCEKANIVSFQELNNRLFPKTNIVIYIIYNVCLAITCATMLSGCQSLFDGLYECTFPFESVVIALLTLVLLSKGINFIAKCSLPLSILMVIFILLNCFINFPSVSIENMCESSWTGILFAGLFIASNFLLMVSLVLSIKIKRRKALFIAFAISIAIILTSIFIALASNKIDASSEMPLLDLCQGSAISVGFVISILLAMLTTFITSLYALNNNMTIIFKDEKLSAIICITVIYICSMLSFNSLVNYGFPAMGVLGAIFFIRTVIFSFGKK